MTNEEPVVDAIDQEVVQEPKTFTVEELTDEVTKLKSIKNDVVQERDQLKSRVRELEKVTEGFKNFKPDVELKQQLDSALNQIQELDVKYKNTVAKTRVERALVDNKVNPVAVNTALDLVKLDNIKWANGEIDETSIADAITLIKNNHPVLFNEVVPAPSPRRPEDKPNVSSYEAELQSLLKRGVNQLELTALKRKYGR